MRYWSRERVKGPTTKIENTRPYIISRLPHKYDASNIEATAYALLVHVERNAVIQREIVEWLNSQRLTYGGWASTQVIYFKFLYIMHSLYLYLRETT